MLQGRSNVPDVEIGSEEDREIFRILSTANTIAVVGATNRESMPVYGVMLYLQNQV
jgi:predicted CoA-binding protein